MDSGIKGIIFRSVIFILLILFCIFAWKYSLPKKEVVQKEIFSSLIKKDKYVVNKIAPREKRSDIVLALYDGTEKTSRVQNDIKLFAEDVLTAMGLKVEYHDISSGIPQEKSMKKYRAVITWYRDSEMPHALTYCQWIADQVRDGCKVIVLGNFGAYKDSRTEKWLNINEVNIAFNAIGLVYKANWTSNPNVIKVSFKDSDMVEYRHPLSLEETRHYFCFQSILKKNRIYLSLERTDIPQGQSDIVVSTPYGGMALSRYIYYNDPDTHDTKFRLNISRFFKETLSGEASPTSQKVLVVWEPEDNQSYLYAQNAGWALSYAKIDYEMVDLKDINSLLYYDWEEYSCVIFCTENMWKIGKEHVLKGFKNYVAEGGGAVILYRGYHEELREVFGIKEYKGVYPLQVKGMRFDVPLYPGMDRMKLKEDYDNTIFEFILARGIKIIARAEDKSKEYHEGIPLLWEYTYKKGRTLFWNVDSLWSKGFRGFIVQSVMRAQEIGISSLANIEIVQIDDCPLPMWNKYIDPISTEYNLMDSEFYVEQWWPDMLSFSKRHDIQYTAFTIFNYNGIVSPPYSHAQFYQGKDLSSKRLGWDILDAGVELGLHGYNHQSLVMEMAGMKSWESQENMVLALTSAREEWKRSFPVMPFSYVAPNNVISPEGESALLRVFPEVKVISTVWAPAEDETGKEFSVDPWNENFYNIPRMSSGYLLSDEVIHGMLNGIATFGVWTHFIHADDVYNQLRSRGKNWRQLLEGFEELFSFVRGAYPWLRNMSTRDAYYEFLRYEHTPVQYTIDNKMVTIDYPEESSMCYFFLVRINTSQEIEKMVGCKKIFEYPLQGCYIFKTNGPSARIYLK